MEPSKPLESNTSGTTRSMPKILLQLEQDAVYKQIQEELGKSKADIEKDVKIIQDWLKTQPHLPDIPGAEVIQSFLLFNKFSIERTKTKIDMYYTVRGVIPDMFNKHPSSPEMKLHARISYVIPLPKLAKDNRRVLYSKFSDEYGPEVFNYDRFLCHIMNVFEIMLREDLFLGVHFIFDSSSFKLGHMTRMNPMILKKASVVMEKVFSNRVASINIINYHPAFESILNLTKTLLPEKVRSRIKVHKDQQSLYDAFGRELLPKDIGGEEDSLSDLADLWIEKLDQNRELFSKLGSMRVDESKRPSKLKNDEFLGFYGNFKTLEFD